MTAQHLTATHERPEPKVVDPAAWSRFRALAVQAHMDPDDPWAGGYVGYEWTHGRHFFEAYVDRLDGARVLEFGCNVGASAVVLAQLGAEVIGVEPSETYAGLAQAQAEAYGLSSRIKILQLDDTSRMPFPDRHFRLIVCNSVLEYVQPKDMPAVQHELVRVLEPGGVLLIMGTSSRLWPREVHSRRWLTNYLPRSWDRVLRLGDVERGVSPFAVRRGFRDCVLVDKEDNYRAYFQARERMGTGGRNQAILRAAATVLKPFPVVVGMLTPSFSMALRRLPSK